MVGQSEADRQVRYGQVEHELVGDERRQASAHRDSEDREGVPADDEQHERAVDDTPGPVVIEVGMRARVGRVPAGIGLVGGYNVHNIAGRGPRRRPLGIIRRRVRFSLGHCLKCRRHSPLSLDSRTGLQRVHWYTFFIC